jgi:sugar phosphate isomerase/epimerase
MSTLSRREILAGLGAGMMASAADGVDSRSSAPAAKFKLGLVTYNIAATWDLQTVLKVCKDVGLAAVEFRTTHKHGVEPSLTKEQRKEVRKKCEDSAISISGCASVCKFHDPSPATVR